MDADKLEDARERYFIMSSQKDISREYIARHLAGTYGQEIAGYILAGESPGNRPKRAGNGDFSTIPANNTGGDQTAPEKPAIDVCTLEKYIFEGARLIPTRPTPEGGFYQLKRAGDVVKIDTPEGLHYWTGQGVERFIFIPKEAGFLCLDLDRGHGDGVDGVSNFASWLDSNGLGDLPLLRGLDDFPTYTATASGGLHLYFKCKGDLTTFATIAPGVEVKYNGRSLTAGGSVKNGKPYFLRGELSRAPIIPAPLLLKLTKILSREPPSPKHRTYRAPDREKQGYTADQLLDFARQDSRGGAHDTIFQMATRLKRAGYTHADTLAIIEATPEHQGRRNQQDTLTCINSIF